MDKGTGYESPFLKLFMAHPSKITNLANASSIIFNALLAFPKYFGREDGRAVNWCGGTLSSYDMKAAADGGKLSGFYLDSALFPAPRIQTNTATTEASSRLLLGPFCGKPACQFIHTAPGKARGVCADAYLTRTTIVVPEVDLYPAHIACDGETKSEVVCPLVLEHDGATTVLGVLDLDCLAVGGFNDEDKVGLEKMAKLLVNSCDW